MKVQAPLHLFSFLCDELHPPFPFIVLYVVLETDFYHSDSHKCL